jgi:hypothetical protein
MMGKSLRDRAFVLRMEPSFTVSTLRASIAFAALLLAGCDSRPYWRTCTYTPTGEVFQAVDSWVDHPRLRDKSGFEFDVKIYPKRNQPPLWRCTR